MRPINVIRIALAIGAAAWIVMLIKQRGARAAGRKIIAGTIGGVIGFLVPFSVAMIYILLGGDQAAAGVFSFFGMFTVPVGIGVGVTYAGREH